MRRILLFAVGAVALVLLIGGGLLFVPAVQDWVIARGVEQQVAQKPVDVSDPNTLKVLICGSEPPPPSAKRAKACTAIVAGGRVFIIDTGPGSANKLALWRFPLNRISGVLITHFHSDHIGDLGEFRMQSWATGRAAPLPVYGPYGVDRIVDGINMVYAADDAVRGTEHGLSVPAAQLVARPFGLASSAERRTHMGRRVIYDRDGLRITAFQVHHEPVYPAVGYRFDYRGRSVVVSGDTTVSPNLVRTARGADVLVHEAHTDTGRIMMVNALRKAGQDHLAGVISQIGNYHATPVEAARVANAAKVRLLVYSHMGPIPPDNALTRAFFARGVGDVRPHDGWTIADDGLLLTLPVGFGEITPSTIR